jgi:hypothetical protein
VQARLFDECCCRDFPRAKLILSPDPVDRRDIAAALRGEVPGIAAGVDFKAVESPVIPVASDVDRLKRDLRNGAIDGPGELEDVFLMAIVEPRGLRLAIIACWPSARLSRATSRLGQWLPAIPRARSRPISPDIAISL